MNKNITGLSIVLPTINESENLKKIIPDLISNIVFLENSIVLDKDKSNL